MMQVYRYHFKNTVFDNWPTEHYRSFVGKDLTKIRYDAVKYGQLFANFIKQDIFMDARYDAFKLNIKRGV